MSDYYLKECVMNLKKKTAALDDEMVMISDTNVLFVNSQALKEDGTWLYKFRFLTHASVKDETENNQDKLCKARLSLAGIANTKNQHYYFCEESVNLDSIPNKRKYISRFDDYLFGSSGIAASGSKEDSKLAVQQAQEPKIISWKWSTSSTQKGSGDYKSNKITDFERRAFFREWELIPTNKMSQHWEVKIEVPPKEEVAFIFTYDIWDCSGERLSGTPIICKICSPADLSDDNNYKGVSFERKVPE